MCCEDVKIDYSKHSAGRLIALTAASQELFAADPYRWSIMVAPPTSGVLWIQPDAVAVVGNGIPLQVGMLPLTITRRDVGNLVGKTWNAIHSAGGVNGFVSETFLIPHEVCKDLYAKLENYSQPTAGYGKLGSAETAKRVAAGF